MTPREIVLAAVAHRATAVIPYGLDIEAETWPKVDAHYGSREQFPRHETFFAGRGFDWRGGSETLPGNRFRDVFGVLWQQGNIFHIVEPVLKRPRLDGFRFPSLVNGDEVAVLAQWCDENAHLFRTYNLGLAFFERAWALRGMENLLMDMAAEPAFVHELLERLMELHLEALDKILDLPLDAIRFGDDFGSQRGLIMGLRHWRTYIKPRLARMYGKVRGAGKMVSIHSCGDNSEILGEMIEMGLQIFNPAQPEPQDLAALKREFGKDLTFDGGIGTQGALPFGTPDQVREEIRRARAALGPGGGWIMRTTKALRPEVPMANAVAAIETIIEEAHKGTPR